MIPIFFNGTDRFLMNVMPDGRVMDSTYFAEEIANDLESFCYLEGRNTHERHLALNFENASKHISEKVREKSVITEFTRLKHPFCNQDLAHCDFFFFWYIKEKLKGKEVVNNDTLSSSGRKVLNGIPLDRFVRVFHD
jgi:hypothetical protein